MVGERMTRAGKMDETDKIIAYCYRNGYPIKDICVKTGLSVGKVGYRLDKLRKAGLKKWWQE